MFSNICFVSTTKDGCHSIASPGVPKRSKVTKNSGFDWWLKSQTMVCCHHTTENAVLFKKKISPYVIWSFLNFVLMNRFFLKNQNVS